MLERLELRQTNRDVDGLLHWSRQGLLYLDAPYQRGVVWGSKRRVNLIKSMLMGVPVPSLVLNDRCRVRAFEDVGDYRVAVIDGKQRITSILSFLEGSFSVPADWFGYDDRETVTFPDLDTPRQLRFKRLGVGMYEGTLGSVEAEAAVFDLINFGGLLQGEVDDDLPMPKRVTGVDPGEGYRLLVPDEIVVPGDEFLQGERWCPCRHSLDKPAQLLDFPIRRRV